MTHGVASNRGRIAVAGSALDKLGVVLAAITMIGLGFQPFALFRANRIIAAKSVALWSALPAVEAALLAAVIVACAAVIGLRTTTLLRLVTSLAGLALLAIMVGRAGAYLTPPDNPYARVSPGGGFWLMVFGLAMALADAIVRLRLSPLKRIGLLAVAAGAVALLLTSGAWDALSILREYSNRAAAFWREARIHALLAGGSLAAAALIGIPLGLICFRFRSLRAAILNSLNILQTIPSMALFGLLIAPLGWVGAHVPGAAAVGIAGIGVAPAFIALFAYSLLPMVSNTVAGLEGVAPDVREAARGMGMTAGQRLLRIEIPLALPVILTGIRIVLVQNIGLAVIAALIGGGGFGTFVFQGISQTATDLVLLGALPVVALAFAAAVILDALVDLTRPDGRPQT